jgi:heme-degrading monooxygenase HmoA
VAHYAGVGESGRIVVDIWESRDAFDSFFASRLGPALEAAGMDQPTGIATFEVYNNIYSND